MDGLLVISEQSVYPTGCKECGRAIWWWDVLPDEHARCFDCNPASDIKEVVRDPPATDELIS